MNNVKNPNSDPFLLLPTDRTKKAARDETRSWEMVRSRRVVFTLTQQGEEAGGVPIFCISFLMIFASNKLAGDISSYSRESACTIYPTYIPTSIRSISHIITKPAKEKFIIAPQYKEKSDQSSKSPLLTGCKTICGKHIIPPIPPSLILLLSHSFPPNSPSASFPFHPIHRL